MKCSNPPFSASSRDHVIRWGSRVIVRPSKSVILTPSFDRTTISRSITYTTRFVCFRRAGMSDARKFSSVPNPMRRCGADGGARSPGASSLRCPTRRPPPSRRCTPPRPHPAQLRDSTDPTGVPLNPGVLLGGPTQSPLPLVEPRAEFDSMDVLGHEMPREGNTDQHPGGTLGKRAIVAHVLFEVRILVERPCAPCD